MLYRNKDNNICMCVIKKHDPIYINNSNIYMHTKNYLFTKLKSKRNLKTNTKGNLEFPHISY